MLFNLQSSKNSEITTAPKSNAQIPAKIGRYVVRVKDIVYWLLYGPICPYPRNRGGNPKKMQPNVGSKTVASVRNDFHPPSYGGIIIAKVDQKLRETYNIDPKYQYMLADGHGSTMGVVKRLYDGKLTKQDLEGEAFLTIVDSEEFIRVYTHRNIQTAQTAGQTLTNPDLVYGSIIFNKLYPLLTEDAQTVISAKSGKLFQQLAYVIESWKHRGTSKWRYPTLFRTRTIVTPKSIQPANAQHYRITQEGFKELANACNFYGEYIVRLTDEVVESGGDTDSLKGILNSGPFFGVILTDMLAEEPLIIPKDRKVGVFVNQSKRNLGALSLALPSLTNGRDVLIENSLVNLAKILKKKKS
jgi:hypothetical protein